MLRAFPQRLRMLIHTDINAGYRCGHLHALALTLHVWVRFRWVVSLSGPDVLLTPPAMLQIGASLRNWFQPPSRRGSNLTTTTLLTTTQSSATRLADAPLADEATPADPTALETARAPSWRVATSHASMRPAKSPPHRSSRLFLADYFVRYKHVSLCMDCFAFPVRALLPDPRARSPWHLAAEYCSERSARVTEGVLQWMVDTHNFSRKPAAPPRAGACTSHAIGQGGVWHVGTGAMPHVQQWLENVSRPDSAFSAALLSAPRQNLSALWDRTGWKSVARLLGTYP